VWAQLGSVLLLRQDYGSASEALTRALQLSPDDPHARHRLAQALLARGDRAAARRELERVLVQHPRHLSAALDLAVLELSADDAAAALERLDRVLAEDPTDAKASFYRALALRQLAREAPARAALQRLAAGASRYAQRAQALLHAQAAGAA
jgi:Tfp pilus assembly protein PilF